MRFWNMEPDGEMGPDGEQTADSVLDIEGPIATDAFWGDETSSREFRQALESVGNVTVRINSPGGDVLAGAEIYSALREHSMNGRGRVKVIITALAASAASVIAMAGDEILISPVAYMMIHNPWSSATGDAREMRKTAKTLDEITEGLITAYQRRTGKTRDQLKRMLDNETWMSAQTCVDEGFADGIYGGEIRAAAMAGTGMLTRATPEAIAEMCTRWEASRKQGAEEDPEEDTPEREPEEGEEPETEETEPDGRADGAPASAEAEEDEPEDPDEPEEEPDEEEPEEPDGEPDEETDPDDPEEEPDGDPDEDAEDMARTEARALLMDEILQVRILMSQEM